MSIDIDKYYENLIKKTRYSLSGIIIVFFMNWIFQGILNMDKTDRIFKLFLDLTLTLLIYIILVNNSNYITVISLAFVIAHTFNWVFNGHIYSLAKPFGRGQKPQSLLNITKTLGDRISKEKSIQGAAIFGSIARNEITENSDIDVAIIRRRGFINGLRVCSFGFFERFRAFLAKVPLDLFVVDSIEHLSKYWKEKNVVILHDPERIFEKRYKQT